MSHKEYLVAAKTLPDDTTCRIYHDPLAESPRQWEKPNTTFCMYPNSFGEAEIGDVGSDVSPFLFLRALFMMQFPEMEEMSDDEALRFMLANQYPGVLRTVLMHTSQKVSFETLPFRFPPNGATLFAEYPVRRYMPLDYSGYMAVTPGAIASGSLDGEDPHDVIRWELSGVAQYLNREVYYIEAVFPDGREDGMGRHYPNSGIPLEDAWNYVLEDMGVPREQLEAVKWALLD